MPRLSVLIPCFNSASWLGEALESLAAQTRLPDEVIIADDGSTDAAMIALLDDLAKSGSAERAGSGSLSRRGLPITVLRERPTSPGPTRNAAVRASTGELLLPLDADDALAPRALELLEAALVADGSADFAFSHVEYFGAVHGVAVPPRYNPWLQTVDNKLVVTALLRRRIFEAGAWYATEEGYEDWSFWLAVVERELHGICVEEPLFRYRRKAGVGQLALDHGRREQLKQALRQRHPQLYTAEAQARLKTRWAPAIEFVAPAEARDTIALFLLGQSLRDVRLTEAARPIVDAPTLLREVRGKLLLFVPAGAVAALVGAPASFLEDLAAKAEAHRDRDALVLPSGLLLLRTDRASRLRHDHLPAGAPIEALPRLFLRGDGALHLRLDLSEDAPAVDAAGPAKAASRKRDALRALPQRLATSVALPLWRRARATAVTLVGEQRISEALHPWKERITDARSWIDGVQTAVRGGRVPRHGDAILTPSEREERRILDGVPAGIQPE